MRRRAAGTAALALVWAGIACGAADAQPLQTLHVRTFTTAVDPATVHAGDVFHLVITIRVDENVSSIDNIRLPDTSDFTEQGDERRLTSNGTGTLYTETLTLTPSTPGVKVISPAVFEAVDAKTGKPSRFASDEATVRVLPALAEGAGGLDAFWFEALRREAGRLLALALRLAFFGGLLVVGIRMLRRRTRRATAVPLPQAPAESFPRRARTGDPTRLRDLTTDLERDPSRRRILDVRQYLLVCACVHEHETLIDLERRLGGRVAPAFLAALHAAEQASFCEDERLSPAIASAVKALHVLAETPGALEISA